MCVRVREWRVCEGEGECVSVLLTWEHINVGLHSGYVIGLARDTTNTVREDMKKGDNDLENGALESRVSGMRPHVQ